MKDALLLIAGMMIGIGMWAALPSEPPRVERVHVPYITERLVSVPIETECQKPPRIVKASCPPHRSLESLALACTEGRLTHDGKVGILVENQK